MVMNLKTLRRKKLCFLAPFTIVSKFRNKKTKMKRKMNKLFHKVNKIS